MSNKKVDLKIERKRGKFLTILLVLGIIGIIPSLFHIFDREVVLYKQLIIPSVWFSVIVSVNTLMNAGGILGIWLWKKWGVYFIGLSIILQLVVQAVYVNPLYGGPGLVAYLVGFFFDFLWTWALYRKWHYFQ